MNEEAQERSDLLSGKRREITTAVTNGNVNAENDPPDGGFKACGVVVSSFLTNGIIFGVINCYSVIYTVLQKQLHENGVPNSESRASLVGALTMGTTFAVSPISGVLAGLLGLRLTAVLGGSIAATGLLISSFLVDQVDALCFTYGIMYGLGASLAYTPSLVILGHYFKRYLSLVNGIVCVGSSIFTVIMPPLMQYMIQQYGLEGLFRFLAVLTIGVALCGLLFKPIPLIVIEKPVNDSCFKLLKNAIVDVRIWKNMKYRIWALSMPVALFGYFVPYVHIKEFININFVDAHSNLPLQCMAVTSGLGRLIFGFLGDRPHINTIMLQQISFYVIGSMTIILPFMNNFIMVVIISLCMGLFDGAFISLIGPIAFAFCGRSSAAQAIGCMLGMAALPLSLGPPIAGYLFGKTKSYTLPFVLAGISPLVGATLMFAIRFQGYKRRKHLRQNLTIIDADKTTNSPSAPNGTTTHQQTAL